jgi:protein-disulfide isomerase
MAVLKRKKEAADELKIPHTPFVYIGGEAYEGERTPELIGKFIDKKMAEISVVKKP